MIKRVCIDNSGFDLTVGKIYDIRILKYFYTVTDDTGSSSYVSKNWFISLEEFRNNKINQIINE